MRSNRPVLVAIIAVSFTFIFGATFGVAQAETFCPEGGERFTGSEKFCPTHGAALKSVGGTATLKHNVSAPKIKETAESKAAKQKQATEWFKQAQNYYFGDGVERDTAKAMSFHRKAANAGNAVAQVSLGSIYETGDEGFEVNFNEALKWYRMAVAQGDPVGLYALANMYLAGKGVEQDYAKAAGMYSESSEKESRGRHLAQQQLGDLYLEGKGVGKDFEKAESYWLAAVGTGYAYSQNLLGLRYEYGAFGMVNLDKATKYYRLAAQQGHKDAKAALARLNVEEIEPELVEEVLNAGGYTYLRVKSGGQARWVAAPQFVVRVGETVKVPMGMEMTDFESKTLGRVFDSLSFVDQVKVVE